MYAAILGAPAPRVIAGQERGARYASNQKARHHLRWQLLTPVSGTMGLCARYRSEDRAAL